MTGELHGVSAAIGKLQGQVETLTQASRDADKSRSDMHEKINALGQAQAEISTTLHNMAGSIEALAVTVKSHETIKQQATGAKTIFTSILTAGGAVGIFEGVKHFFK